MPSRRRRHNRKVVDRRIARIEREISQSRRLSDATIRADRVTFRDWVRAVMHNRLRVLYAHPHHYATAIGVSGVLVAAGYAERAAIVAGFAYALVENVVSAADKA